MTDHLMRLWVALAAGAGAAIIVGVLEVAASIRLRWPLLAGVVTGVGVYLWDLWTEWRERQVPGE